MYRPKNQATFKIGVQALRAFFKAREEAKKATNALNKAKTVVKDFLKDFVRTEGLPPATEIVVDGVTYSYAAAVSDVIDPRKWHKMWQDGEITEQQYFDCMSVSKTEAKQCIGDDQAMTITITVPGTKADVRVDEKAHAAKTGVEVLVSDVKKAGGIKRLNLPGASKPDVQSPARRVIVKAKANG